MSAEYDAGYKVGFENGIPPRTQSDEWVRGFEDGVDDMIAAVLKRSEA